MGIFRLVKQLFDEKSAEPTVPQPSSPGNSASAGAAEQTLMPGMGAAAPEAPAIIKILVIDDSPTIIAVFRKILQPTGHAMVYAESAERGIALAQVEKPDLIFLDIVLPGMNGFAALRALRKEANTRTTPIVMISGNDQAAEKFYADHVRADDFVKKPFKAEDILTRIDRLVLHKRAIGRRA